MATPEEQINFGESLTFDKLEKEPSAGKKAAASLQEITQQREGDGLDTSNLVSGPGEATLIGIGRGMTFVTRGLQQMMNDVPVINSAFEAVGMPLQTDEELAEDTRFYNELVDDPEFGKYAFGGEIVGTLLEPAGLAVPGLRGAGLAKQAAGGAAIGAGFGAVGEVEEGNSRSTNALIGAAAGGMLAPALIAGMKTSRALALSGKKFFTAGGSLKTGTTGAGGKGAQANTRGSASVSDKNIPNPRKPSTTSVARAEESLPPWSVKRIENITGEEVIRGVDGRKLEDFKVDNQLWSQDGLLNNYLDEFSGFLDDSFGGFPAKKDDKDVILLASRLGVTPKEVEKSMKQFVGGGKRVRGRRDPSSRFLAAALTQLKINHNAKQAALRYKATGDQRDFLRWQAHALQQESVRQWVRAGKSELGRSMRILKQVANLDKDPDSLSKFQEIMEELSQHDMTRLASERPEVIEQLMSKVTEASNLLQVSRLMKAGTKPTRSEKAIFFMLNNMLSNVQTHEVNLLSNANMQIIGNADKFMEALLGLPMKNSNRVTMREWAAFTSGQFHGLGKGTRLALDIIRGKAEPATDRTKLELLRRREIKQSLVEDFSKVMPKGLAQGFIGLQDIPGRALVAGDELFKMMARMGESRAQAVRNALNHITVQKRSGGRTFAPGSKEFWRFVDNAQQDILEDPRGAGRKVEQLAEELTFTEEAGPISMSVMKHANSHIWSKALVPFVRTPVNLVKQAFRHSPIRLLDPRLKIWKEAAKGETKALAQTLVGSSIWTYSYLLSDAGYLTGTGPPNPRLRQEREAAGIPPNSFHIKRFARDFGNIDEATLDKWAKDVGFTDGMPEWVEYGRFDPLGIQFGLSSDAAELFNVGVVNNKDGHVLSKLEDENAVGFIVGSFSQNLVDKLYLQSVNDLFQVLNPQGNITGNMERFLKNYLNSTAMAIPGIGTTVSPLAANISRTIDNRRIVRDSDPSKDIFAANLEQSRIWDGIKKQMMEKYPFWKDNLLPERNSLGEVVFYGGKEAKTPIEKATQFLNPAYTNDQSVTPLKAEIFNLGINIEKPQRKISGVTLTDEQYDFYVKRQGELFKQKMEPLVSSEIELDGLKLDGDTRKVLFEDLTPNQLKERYTGLGAGIRIRVMGKMLRKAREEARTELKNRFGLELAPIEEKLEELFVPKIRQ